MVILFSWESHSIPALFLNQCSGLPTCTLLRSPVTLIIKPKVAYEVLTVVYENLSLNLFPIISLLPHSALATSISLYFTHQAQIHSGAVGLELFTQLVPLLHSILFSISCLKSRLPKTRYLKRYFLSFSIPLLCFVFLLSSYLCLKLYWFILLPVSPTKI